MKRRGMAILSSRFIAEEEERAEKLDEEYILGGLEGEQMFAVFLSLLVLVVIAGAGGEIWMRMRLSKLELPREKLLWWRRGGDDVAETYHSLFPKSRLPLFRQIVFWVVLASAGVFLLAIIWKRH
jgi:hypothetical protein